MSQSEGVRKGVFSWELLGRYAIFLLSIACRPERFPGVKGSSRIRHVIYKACEEEHCKLPNVSQLDHDAQTPDEEQLKQAMRRLKLLHIKARNLRDVIPRIVEPLVQLHPTPEIMFNAFMKVVADTQAEITEFTELMRDDESKQVFAQVKKSREDRPNSIKSWRHEDFPHWYDLDKDDL
ncbi:ribosomal L34e [Ophiocordyceps camponoti-floridani]|uniref:Ribosomal L34e n=1 Tax=Ophiocordyceps camponoti-floridani TaxID=2030778 RepID=A0A8H4VEZ6_9HYPO|nr:ribosomal L34e [Ophiocordyceps camponoti-floridani]